MRNYEEEYLAWWHEIYDAERGEKCYFLMPMSGVLDTLRKPRRAQYEILKLDTGLLCKQ